MPFVTQMLSIPQMIGGILTAVLAIMLVYVTSFLTEPIFALWTTYSMMYYASYLIYWLIIFVVLYVHVWIKFFEPILGAAKAIS